MSFFRILLKYTNNKNVRGRQNEKNILIVIKILSVRIINKLKEIDPDANKDNVAKNSPRTCFRKELKKSKRIEDISCCG
jgi:hypothetical protein